MKMKKKLFALAAVSMFCFILFTGLPAFAAGQKKDQGHDKIIETVTVENIEVPVRVFDGKRPVGGLTKNDFQLFLNGKKKQINGFYEVRKALAAKSGQDPQATTAENSRERLFLLLFNLNDYHQDLNSLLDIFFKEVIQPGDRLMVLTNHFFFPEWKTADLEKTKQEVLVLLEKEIKKLRSDKVWFEGELKSMAATLKSRLADPAEKSISIYPAHIYKDFFLTYQLVLEDLRDKYMNLPVDLYINIAKYLKGLDMDKWVLNFYQIGRLPLLDKFGDVGKSLEYYIDLGSSGGQSSGRPGFGSDSNPKEAARRLQSIYYDFQFQMKQSENAMVEDISKAFVNSGATFHTMLLKPINPGFSKDFKYESVHTDSETVLKKVAQMTGGSVITSNKMKTFVKKISAREDIIYMLTYVPGRKEKKSPKLKVTVPGKNYKVLYDNKRRLKAFDRTVKKLDLEKPAIEIEQMAYKDNLLTVKLNNIHMVQYDGDNFGAVQAKIKVTDKQSAIVNSMEKTYKGLKMEGVFQADLPLPANGTYTIVVEVKDLFSLDNRFVGDAITVTKK
jgi:hypothetical protein